MNPNEQAKKQFESIIKADLNRWWAESDLDAEDLSRALPILQEYKSIKITDPIIP